MVFNGRPYQRSVGYICTAINKRVEYLYNDRKLCVLRSAATCADLLRRGR